jgi:hypothetical protein
MSGFCTRRREKVLQGVNIITLEPTVGSCRPAPNAKLLEMAERLFPIGTWNYADQMRGYVRGFNDEPLLFSPEKYVNCFGVISSAAVWVSFIEGTSCGQPIVSDAEGIKPGTHGDSYQIPGDDIESVIN